MLMGMALITKCIVDSYQRRLQLDCISQLLNSNAGQYCVSPKTLWINNIVFLPKRCELTIKLTRSVALAMQAGFHSWMAINAVNASTPYDIGTKSDANMPQLCRIYTIVWHFVPMGHHQHFHPGWHLWCDRIAPLPPSGPRIPSVSHAILMGNIRT